jgi:hypothetical protein
MEEKDDPVSDELCKARMATQKADIDGIKNTIKVTGAVITIIISAVAILVRFL